MNAAFSDVHIYRLSLQQDDAISYINHETKSKTDASAFRKEKLGGNGDEVSFW